MLTDEQYQTCNEYALRLVLSLASRFPAVEGFHAFPDLYGKLSQIDNMTCKLPLGFGSQGELAMARFIGNGHLEINGTPYAEVSPDGRNIFVGLDSEDCEIFNVEEATQIRDWLNKVIPTPGDAVADPKVEA